MFFTNKLKNENLCSLEKQEAELRQCIKDCKEYIFTATNILLETENNHKQFQKYSDQQILKISGENKRDVLQTMENNILLAKELIIELNCKLQIKQQNLTSLCTMKQEAQKRAFG